jgi:hypothetical protein
MPGKILTPLNIHFWVQWNQKLRTQIQNLSKMFRTSVIYYWKNSWNNEETASIHYYDVKFRIESVKLFSTPHVIKSESEPHKTNHPYDTGYWRYIKSSDFAMMFWTLVPVVSVILVTHVCLAFRSLWHSSLLSHLFWAKFTVYIQGYWGRSGSQFVASQPPFFSHSAPWKKTP